MGGVGGSRMCTRAARMRQDDQVRRLLITTVTLARPGRRQVGHSGFTRALDPGV